MKKDRMNTIVGNLLGDGLWDMNLEGLSKAKRRFVRFIKLIRIILNEFAENRMGFQCVALGYYSAMAVIPLAAFIFAVGGGLGLQDRISVLLYNILPNNPEFIDTILRTANNIIDSAKSGLVGTIGAVMFLWTIIWMFYQVERVFNNVWGIRRIPRKLVKRFSFYFLILFLTPFIIVIFGAGIAIYSNITSLLGIHLHIKELSGLTTFFGWLVLYALTSLTFSAMYKFIPAVDVKYRHALVAAAVSGLAFVIFQWFYLNVQIYVTRLNAVYGALAAIPLFLMWLNYSWQIIIYGAQLSYGLQNIDSYQIPEGRLRDFKPMRDRLKREKDEMIREDKKERREKSRRKLEKKLAKLETTMEETKREDIEEENSL